MGTDKLFETINQEFKAKGTKYQVSPNFEICCRELGRLIFVHVCSVSALSNRAKTALAWVKICNFEPPTSVDHDHRIHKNSVDAQTDQIFDQEEKSKNAIMNTDMDQGIYLSLERL